MFARLIFPCIGCHVSSLYAQNWNGLKRDGRRGAGASLDGQYVRRCELVYSCSEKVYSYVARHFQVQGSIFEENESYPNI